jgi:thiamine pyrophosphokinase
MRAVIFANGNLERPELAAGLLRPDDFIIAADGGLHHLRALRLLPYLLIGDLDSVGPDDKDWTADHGVEILHFPRDKDFTDLELAIREALKRGYAEIMIVAALGGRMDQTLGNIGLLLVSNQADCRIWLDDGITEIGLLEHELTISGQIGDLVSLIPLGQTAQGVVTLALKYPLNAETLAPGQTRGISNVMLAETAKVSLAQGKLLCVHIRRSK